MSQDKKLTKIRLDELWQSDEISALNSRGNKYVMFSDAYLGDGRKADDFHENEETFDPTEQYGKPLPCYFNTGCALYSNGITCIEIAEDEIRLVKWHRDTQKNPRFDIYERGKLSEYLNEVVNQ